MYKWNRLRECQQIMGNFKDKLLTDRINFKMKIKISKIFLSCKIAHRIILNSIK